MDFRFNRLVYSGLDLNFSLFHVTAEDAADLRGERVSCENRIAFPIKNSLSWVK